MSQLAGMTMIQLNERLSQLRAADGGRVDNDLCGAAGAEIYGRESVLMALSYAPQGAERDALEQAVRERRLSGEEIAAAERLFAAALAAEEQADREGDDPDQYATMYCQQGLDALTVWRQALEPQR